MPVNTGAEDMVCLVARTDPEEQEGVRLGLEVTLVQGSVRCRALCVPART
ncbi:hypothetical protein [Streptomyces virginiae]